MDNESFELKVIESIRNGNYDELLATIDKNYKQIEIDKIGVGFVNRSLNEDPEYAKIGDSGFDIRAMLDGDIVLKPLERYLVPTGLYFELPQGFELQIRPRSGLANKHGITVLNTPGTIDEQYRGEIKVILVNLSNDNFTIKNGERICQGVLANVTAQRIVKLNRLDKINQNTERGSGGFGHTGKL